ncbi:NAD(P)-binding domain-containing protein [Iamia sp.]|uniref:NAD(P)-binding domain-containing protein n=1 Tax=Iamia sp. TaxID=2722710 RepID=UPI002BABF863|nr:NAD(P)-binding domain-containing protein [Iamia sp.]HXH56092.1 NAD(P)-binding domain-containing protein [Iamia sp.]
MKISIIGLGKMGANMSERLRRAGHDVVGYDRDPDLADVPASLEVWRHGSVVRSWLLDLLAEGLAKDPGLASVRGYADDSGEGRWTVEEAIAHAVPAPAISAALFARFASRQDDSPAMKAIATLRNQFGGHVVQSS